MSYLINEKFLGHKHFLEFFSPEGHKVEMGINSTSAFHALDGINYITFDGTNTTIEGITLGDLGDTVVDGTLDVTGDTSLDGDVTVGGNFTMTDTQWDDLRFPFIGRNIDTTSGRIDYNYSELGVDFADNSRYDDAEQISMIVQFPHAWATGTAISPHLHWIQSSADIPNWLIEYRWYDNGDTVPATWTQAPYGTHAYTYTSGSILQLTEFAISVPVGIDGVSSILDIKFYRDTGNTSSEFAGSDPLSGNALAKEFDIHYQVDSLGSDTEYTK